jgi:hypothetical protein
MPAPKYKIDNTAFNEFLYSILYNAAFDAKKIVPTRYYHLLRSERQAKKFISKANTDEARALLSYLGVEHFMVFVAKDRANFKDLKGILEKFKDDRKLESLQDIIDLKLFVTSDKELITLLGLVSQTIHHKAYSMKLELTRTGYHIRDWSKRLHQEGSTEIIENCRLLAKTLLSCSLTLHKTDFLFGLRPLHIELLLYLYPTQNRYTTTKQIFSFFAGPYNKMKIAAAIKNLVKSQHLQKSAIAKRDEYTITALGIRVVNDYMDTVLHGNNFM